MAIDPITGAPVPACISTCKHDNKNDTGGSMIQCDNCELWIHKDCIKMPPNSKILSLWVCMNCEGIIKTHGELLSRADLRISALETKISNIEVLMNSILDQSKLASAQHSASDTETSTLSSLPALPKPKKSYAVVTYPSTRTATRNPTKLPSSLDLTTLDRDPTTLARDRTKLQSSRKTRFQPSSRGTNPDPSPTLCRQTSPTELFHVSSLSPSTTQKSLETYCVSQGLSVIATEETSRHKHLPWKCYRIRLAVKDSGTILRPEIWPAGVTCDLSSLNRSTNHSPVWGSNTSPDCLALAYSLDAQIYVGGCSPVSTEADIDSWIAARGVKDARSSSLPTSVRARSKAYLVQIPHQCAQPLLDDSFWPEGIYFRRFRPSAQSHVLQTAATTTHLTASQTVVTHTPQAASQT